MKIKEFFNKTSIRDFCSLKKIKHKSRIEKANKNNQISKNYTLEIGRSMVEMLSVLAVIGVLSVAGIIGYKYAMTKYIANETINELNLRAHDISLNMDKMIESNYVGDIQMMMGPITRMGYPITARVSPQYIDYFEIFIKNVPSDVCRELLRTSWTAPYSIFVGIQEYEASADICNQAEQVDLAYEFDKDLTPKDDIEEDNRHEIMRCNNENDCKCGTCESNLCKSYCTDTESCTKNVDNPAYLMCCPKENVVGDMCCISIDENGHCCNSYGQCCPANKPLMDKNGTCHACDERSGINVQGVTYYCSACSNRTLSGNYCTACKEGEFADRSGNCISCNNSGNYFTYATKTECNKCPNRVHGFNDNDKCMLACDTPGTYTEGKPLANVDGICYACDYIGTINLGGWGDNSRCETLCPNRVREGNICIRNGCPTLSALEDVSGNCHPCNITLPIATDEEKCEACINRIYKNGYCILP